MSTFKSGYIENQSKGLTEQAVVKAMSLNDELTAIVDSIRANGPLPPVDFVQIIGSHDLAHFTGNMHFFALEILSRLQAQRNATILDLGCGCGRLALPISRFLDDNGRYIGIDVWKDGIDWCNAHIGQSAPNRTFHTVESANNYYFSDATSRVENNYRLDFIEDRCVDLAFAISLFTHLKRADAAAYFRELGRILKPGGLAYITCFIIDHYFYDYVARTGNHTAVRESEEDRECFYAYSHQDFFAGFSMGVWNQMLADNGLQAICHETGSWAEKPGARVYQDTFIIGRVHG